MKKTILLVEDEAIIALMEEKLLLNFGYNVVKAGNGENSVELALQDEAISLILMDINLGAGIDGTEAAKRILERRNLPIVFLTAHSEKEYVERVKSITRYGYVIKNSGDFVLKSSIEMAYELFEANQKAEKALAEIKLVEDFTKGFNEDQSEIICRFKLDGTYVYVSNLFCSFFGKTREELIGKKWIPEAHPEDIEMINSKLASLSPEKPVVQIINRVYSGNGKLRWINFTNRGFFDWKRNLSEIQSVGRDITPEKLAEEALQKRETLLHLISDHLPAAIAYLDKELRYIYANKNYLTIFSKNRNEIIGYKAEEILEKEYFEKVKTKFFSALEGKHQKFDASMEVEGKVLYLSIDYEPEFDSLGKVIGIFVLAIDISDRKEAENRIKNLLQEKETLLKEVHHRIKNNMNNISALLTLQAKSSKDSSVRESLKDASGRVQSMMLLYNKLYSTATYKEISIKEYLPELLRQIKEHIFPDSPIKLEMNISDFILDSKKLSSIGIIINELISNILKHAFKEQPDCVITVTAKLCDSNVMVTVEDNGQGIPESINPENSPGFGLKLVNMLTKQLGGTVRFESNIGTKVILEFKP